MTQIFERFLLVSFVALSMAAVTLFTPGLTAFADDGSEESEAADTSKGGKDAKPENGKAAKKDANAALLAGDRPSGFSASASLTGSVGQGTFVADDYARNEFGAYSVGLGVGYSFKDSTLLSLGWGFNQELTQSDLTTKNQQVIVNDLTLSARRRLFTIPGINTQFIVRPRLTFPTSLISRAQTLNLAATLGLQLLYPSKYVMVSLASSLRKNWHRSTTSTVSNGDGLPVIQPRNADEISVSGGYSTGNRNPSASLSSSLAVILLPTTHLYVSVSYSLINVWSYPTPEDEFTAGNAQAGTGRLDLGGGGIEVGYQFSPVKNIPGTPIFSIAAGVSTFSQPKSADGQRFRFPFFDFDGPASNRTTFYLRAGSVFNFAK